MRADLKRLHRDRHVSSRQPVVEAEPGLAGGPIPPTASAKPAALAGRKSMRLPWISGTALVALVAVALIAFLVGERAATPAVPTFRELTFRRGALVTARFAPDPRSSIYSSAWVVTPETGFISLPTLSESLLLCLSG